jgi:hypothetical protein
VFPYKLREEKGLAAMTIIRNDEQARLLSDVVKAGGAESTEEAVDRAVRALHSSATARKPVPQQVDNLADLFAKSHSAVSI